MLPNTEKGLQPKALSFLLNTQAAEPEISGIPFETLPLCTKWLNIHGSRLETGLLDVHPHPKPQIPFHSNPLNI